MTENAAQETTPKASKTPKPIGFEPGGDIRTVKAGTKLAALVDALARPEGATLEELATELSRSGSTVDASGVKSWISYDLRRTGLGIKQVEDRLFLIGTPLPHREAAAKKEPQDQALKVVPAGAKKTKKAGMRAPKGSKKARRVVT
jgi:hypothetical protein